MGLAGELPEAAAASVSAVGSLAAGPAAVLDIVCAWDAAWASTRASVLLSSARIVAAKTTATPTGITSACASDSSQSRSTPTD